MSNKVCAVVGAGPGNGRAFAASFHNAGYRVALLARHTDTLSQLKQTVPDAHAFPCDVTVPSQIESAFADIDRELGAVDTLIYNAGAGKFGSIDEVSAGDFELAWRVNALGCLLSVQQVLPGMRTRGSGNIIVIGATASRKGGARFAAFASAKAAQRNLAESMARLLGPEGIHVAYVVIDGVIDLERTRSMFPDQTDEFFMNPAHIADTVFHLSQQPRSAWSFEVDLRPFGERW
ncbi:MAG: SDR family NAD(P)-dependent oxidoreductase [Gammaproteobacteria bacterium]|nr:SDR family NAD(P)-dependent oxidoreductase [Gammaproteobacteria bacterium]